MLSLTSSMKYIDTLATHRGIAHAALSIQQNTKLNVNLCLCDILRTMLISNLSRIIHLCYKGGLSSEVYFN